MNTAVPGTARRACGRESVQEQVERQLAARSRSLPAMLAAALPRRHQREDDRRAIASGTQPPCAILATFAPKNARSMTRNARDQRRPAHSGQPQRCARRPRRAIDVIAIVPVTAMPYAAPSALDDPEAEHEQQAADHERPVHLRDVDLPVLAAPTCGRSSRAGSSRAARLLRERERARDQRLRRDDRGHGRERDQRVEQHARREQKNGFSQPRWVAQDSAPWPK